MKGLKMHDSRISRLKAIVLAGRAIDEGTPVRVLITMGRINVYFGGTGMTIDSIYKLMID